jgi:adenylate cyclase
MAFEIERKFLVGEIPEEAGSIRPSSTRQGYLAVGDDREVRIRQIDRNYLITTKIGQGLQRSEYQVKINAKQFEALWPASEGWRISKSRYRIPLDQGIAELDVFSGVLEGLKTVEVEFATKDDALRFSPPYWFGPDVTGDIQFSNSALSRLTSETARSQLGPLLSPPVLALGAIPFAKINGELQLVIVSTKAGTRWIFPKGSPEPDTTPENTALAEAIEEAGVEGDLIGFAIPAWFWRDWQCYRIEYWPMEVHMIRTKWEEDSFRKRKLCSQEEAHELLENASMSRALRMASERINFKNPNI